MQAFLHHFVLASPLYLLALLGYLLARSGRWSIEAGDALSRFAYSVAMPAMLFRMMYGFSSMPPVDFRLLLAFFGGCLIVFFIGRLLAWGLFRLDGTAQSVFALGGVFSNNVMLGVAIAKTNLGNEALPVVSLVIVFNALILWTLVTVSVEWSRHGDLSLQGFGRTARKVMTNPIVAAILTGTGYGYAGLPIPVVLDQPLGLLGNAAVPLSMVALGMGLAQYRIGEHLDLTLAMSGVKLVIQPVAVYLLARALGLPALETKVVTMLASLATGVNVYMMAQQFRVMQGPVAAATVMTTFLSSVTTPVALALLGE